jgi:hydrogenase maturation factor
MKTKQIRGYPEYTVNTDGIIVSYKKELNPRVLKHSVGKIGYCNVGLVNVLGIKKTLSVHCIIAETFLDYKSNKGVISIDHVDEDKTNNNLKNLRIINHRENVARSSNNPTGYTGVKSVNNSFGFSLTFDKVMISSQGHETPLDAHLSRLGLVKTINNL